MKPTCCVAKEEINNKIQKALLEFKLNWNSNEKVYEEMCFCILTPQSSAKQAIKTITLLKQHDLLTRGTAKDKEEFLKNVRFYRTKSARLEIVQEKFAALHIKRILGEAGLPLDPIKCREFLVNEVNGYGYKEASHFLRNIGFGGEVAILDRHILKNLVKCKIINELPKTLTKKKYLEIENKMKEFCMVHKINFAELDLVFWSNETGNVLK